jgi:putative ABC transport system permease protein
VVGVVGDINYAGLSSGMNMSIYQPHRRFAARTMVLVAHTDVDPMDVAPSVRDLIRNLDADVPVFSVNSMEERAGRSLWQQRLNSGLLGVFAMLALTLAAIGIYGVVAFSVSRRHQELGVRVALGADRGDILRMFLRQSVSLIAIGTSLGLVGALIVSRALGGVLYGVRPQDPSTYALVLATMVFTALLASYIPARRAAKTDPSVTLRYQ